MPLHETTWDHDLLRFTVGSVLCEFDGVKWATPNASLTVLLNETTAHLSRACLTVQSLAEDTLRTAGLEKISHAVRPHRPGANE
ncbi:MAG TPA: hypothetical protein VFV96_05340 [Verrucomicrobiae bacterium]|nr:hypothetical protein [Verrucomicrobiae bacterium]